MVEISKTQICSFRGQNSIIKLNKFVMSIRTNEIKMYIGKSNTNLMT